MKVRDDVTAVMIGIDPHKGSHTATALDTTEVELGRLKVRAGRRQAKQLLAWATPFPVRTWAIESATVSATCRPRSFWPPPVNRSWMCGTLAAWVRSWAVAGNVRGPWLLSLIFRRMAARSWWVPWEDVDTWDGGIIRIRRQRADLGPPP
jgi:hypothetical protein